MQKNFDVLFADEPCCDSGESRSGTRLSRVAAA